MSTKFEDSVVISGIGISDVGRRLNREDIDLTCDAALAAINDAGLVRDDIDGLSTYPGKIPGTAPGFTGPGSPEVQDALGLKLNWHHGGLEGPGQFSAFIAACLAVHAGLARHVLVYRTVTEATGQGAGRRAAAGGGVSRVSGYQASLLPFGSMSAASWQAVYANRYMHEYGMTREQLAHIALNGRRNAALNPRAIYRDPITMQEYLDARMIAYPFGLYDCDVPCDGSVAVIVSHVDTAADLRADPIRVEAVGSALTDRPSWDQRVDLMGMAAHDAGRHLWSRTDLKPADVDVAQLYDGFSYLTVAWLEAMGFCGRGEAGEFIDGGERIALDGELPLNTWGGQLSGGRLHAFGHLHEACLQLRGGAGERQVDGASVAAVAAGGGPVAGCLLLRR